MKNHPIFIDKHYSLGESFFDLGAPAAFPDHKLRFRNNRASKLIGLDHLTNDQWIDHFGKFLKFPKVSHKPLVLKYHGHQFGQYNPDLGDGRGFLLCQILAKNNILWDLGTKGSGQTKYSRNGDGRLTLKGAVRELLATEFLSALGVNTSQTLSIIETFEKLDRSDEPSPTRSAVLVRRCNGHIRIGTFQRLAYLNQKENIEILLYHLAKNYFLNINSKSKIEILAEDIFLETVKKIADTMGKIIIAGFVHGVLNTDNFNVTGEVFDYGPWRFVEFANPNFTAAYFDYNGRYSFGRQPDAALWALTQLGKSLNDFISEKRILEILNLFSAHFNTSLNKHFCWRMGIKEIDPKNLNTIIKILFNDSKNYKIDFASFFHDFYGGKDSVNDCLNSNYGNKYKSNNMIQITEILQDTIANEFNQEKIMSIKENKQNMLISEVEEIWQQIDEFDNWELLNLKVKKLRNLGDLLNSQKLANF